MPRIYDKENNPLDYCRDCFPGEDVFLNEQGCWDNKNDMEKCRFCNLAYGESDRCCHYGYNCDHPSYEDTEYECAECDCELTSEDD